MNRKIVIAGATGLIGKRIVGKLIQRDKEIVVLTRSVERAKRELPNVKDFVLFDYDKEISPDLINAVSRVDAIINLAGENIMAKRWANDHKKNVLESRVKYTEKLIEAIERADNKPRTFISASAVGFYGNRFDKVDEDSKKGGGFLADVSDAWEKATFSLDQLDIRRINIRIGIVLAKGGGALPKFVLPFKFFAGGSPGNGKQWVPWIHIDDLIEIFLFALENESVNGIVNAVSPNAVTMKEFAKTIGNVLNRPSFITVPTFVLKVILGEAASSVLEGANVIPQKLSSNGFEFNFTDLRKALTDLLK